MSEKRYWGKYKTVKGVVTIVYLKRPMTREKMLEKHDTYRHLSKPCTEQTK